ncbi:MAG: DUF4158 domain-containing protein [Candidatus Paracaedibacteraceae bacterium]|nr:DUF4158 domain-containing protein [Candidatus Paracaedibacteraceae bacterium]
MPVDFLTEKQKLNYGKFSGQPNDMQLARYFHVDENDMAFIAKRRGAKNRFGFALQLISLRFLGTFISDLSLIPINVKSFIALQLSLNDMSILANYGQRETTKREHAALIRKEYGYHEFGDFPWFFGLGRLLYSRAWLSNQRPSLMFDGATSWLIQTKVILPGATTMLRFISQIRQRADSRLWHRLSSLPSDEQRRKLETLLQVPEGRRISQFDLYRQSPSTVSGPSFNESANRYTKLKEFGMQALNLSKIPPVRLKNLARYAGLISMHKIARMPDSKRIALLVAFAKTYETIALDDTVDVLDLLIKGIARTAKKIGQKKRLRTIKDLDKSALILADICALILKDETQDSSLRETIFSRVSKDKLTASVATINDLARPDDDNFHDEMVQQYGRVRQFLPSLLQNIKLKALSH